jgi:hypothetical protein
LERGKEPLDRTDGVLSQVGAIAVAQERGATLRPDVLIAREVFGEDVRRASCASSRG